MAGWIKLHRSLLDWEWYEDPNTKIVFLHLLLSANSKDGRWQGLEVKRGQFVSSYPILAKKLRLSERNVRTALNHLKTTGEVTVKSHSKFSVFSIVNYDKFQESDRQSDRQVTDNRQASDRQVTTNKKERNKEGKNKEREKEQLTLDQYKSLCLKYSTNLIDYYVEKTKKYKCCNAKTIEQWIGEDQDKVPAKKNQFTDVEQRSYDMVELERRLLLGGE